MDPHAREQRERQADVQEHEEREQAVERRGCAARPLAEPFQGGKKGELRARIPHQPVADDARSVEQPHERHARDPAECAKAAEPAEPRFPDQVRAGNDDKCVGGVAVHAAQNAAEPPFQIAYGVVGAGEAGIEADVEINPASGEQPEEVIAESAEMAQRLRCGRQSHPGSH